MGKQMVGVLNYRNQTILNYPEKIYKIYLKNSDRLALRQFLSGKTQQVNELEEKLQALSEQRAKLEANRKEVATKADDAESKLSAERQVFLLKAKNDDKLAEKQKILALSSIQRRIRARQQKAIGLFVSIEIFIRHKKSYCFASSGRSKEGADAPAGGTPFGGNG
jgi:uncharacterized protein (UPF0335 family)